MSTGIKDPPEPREDEGEDLIIPISQSIIFDQHSPINGAADVGAEGKAGDSLGDEVVDAAPPQRTFHPIFVADLKRMLKKSG